MTQKIFNYSLNSRNTIDDFYVSQSNIDAYKHITENANIDNTIIFGPSKCGKSHLGNIWMNKNHALIYDHNNYRSILEDKKNIFIDDLFIKFNEENIFHLINHCLNNNLKLLILTNKLISNYDFKLLDLSSRLKSFHFIKINQPDDELINNLFIKLLNDKQIIIKNPDVISYVFKRINRTYESINFFIEKVDKLSLEKKRELTIPLIRELI